MQNAAERLPKPAAVQKGVEKTGRRKNPPQVRTNANVDAAAESLESSWEEVTKMSDENTMEPKMEGDMMEPKMEPKMEGDTMEPKMEGEPTMGD